MRVKNVNGSGRFSAPAGYRSWLDYWEKKTDSKAIFVPLPTVLVVT